MTKLHCSAWAPAKARAPKAKTAEQIASEYFLGANSAMPSAARGGGGTRDFLTEHGAIEHRVSALQAHRYALEEVGGGQLQASLPRKQRTGATSSHPSFTSVWDHVFFALPNHMHPPPTKRGN